MSPLEAQKKARKTTSYGPIWIHRPGDYVVVEVEGPDGSWVEVIREQVDGNYSHIIEPLGIEAVINAKKAG